MKKALLSLNTDLGSSIAVRYTNELTSRINMIVQDIHVVEPSQSGSEPGSGWVRKTWETALVESSENEIKHFLEMEKAEARHLKVPKILIGDRTEKLLGELNNGEYHLFIEGVVPTLSPSDFYTRVTSRLYRLMPCPVLIVKNLVMLEKAVLLLDESTDIQSFTASFVALFDTDKIAIDLLHITSIKSGDVTYSESEPEKGRLEICKQKFLAKGITPHECRIVSGSAQKISELLREYGLVAAALNYNPRKNTPMVDLLGRTPSPVLICWH